MATRVLFSKLIQDTKLEIGGAYDSATSTGFEELLKYKINSHYELLYEQYFSDLRIRETLTLKTGQRYYSYPDLGSIRPNNIQEFYKIDSGIVYPILRGIFAEDYAFPDTQIYYNTYRYDWVFDGVNDKLEIHPTPEKDEDVIAELRHVFEPLVNETDRCMIDDKLVIFAAAKDILASRGEPTDHIDAKFNYRLAQVKSNQQFKGDVNTNLTGPSYGDILDRAVYAAALTHAKM